MANRVKTEAANAHLHPRFWQRLTPFLDVIGAVLIFGSWIFSHTLSQRALDQSNRHQAIITRVRQFRLYDDFAQRISDIQSDLARTRNLVESLIERSGQAEAISGVPKWTGMSTTQIRELNDFVRDLAKYAGQMSIPETATQSIDAAKVSVQELTSSFDSARNEFDRLVQNRKKSNSTSNDAAADREEEELRKSVGQLMKDYDSDKESMLTVGDQLLRTAAQESKTAGLLAKRCEYFSWALYVVGTLIILYGRAKSVLSSGKKTVE